MIAMDTSASATNPRAELPSVEALMLDGDAAYQALTARDARFDGRLFVGVTSTRIYCRPICRVRTPMRKI